MSEPTNRDDDLPADRSAEWLVAYDAALLSGVNQAGSAELLPTPDDCPDFARDVACLELLHRVLRPAGDPEQAVTVGSGPFPSPRPEARVEIPKRIGRFEVLRELGRGGYGIVLLAIDPNLDRRVAIKIPRPEVLVSSVLRERFLREAETAGRLDHPNLVPVFEVGEDGPLWYIAAAYVSGGTLSHWISSLSSPLTPRTAASLVAHLADAAQHAHSAGILHRDIKPGNVLMQPESESTEDESLSPFAVLGFVPRLCDFGLAKLLDTEGDETVSGTLLGTPSYMAPEQATGRTAELGTATDVYGLGAILYELLTGAAPFRGGNSIETLRQVLHEEVVPPHKLRRNIDRDLEAICLKCLEKKREHRYQTARELAMDLRRYLAGEPTEARPVTQSERLVKWCRREPAMAALGALALVASIALVTGLAWSNVRISRALGRAQESDRKSRQLLYATDLQLAQQSMLNSDFGAAKTILRKHIPAAGEADPREFAWWFLWNAMHREIASLPNQEGDVYSLAFAPDGKRFATVCRDGFTRVWSSPGHKLITKLADHQGEVNTVAYSPDGALLATGGDDRQVIIRDVKDYRIRHRLLTPDAPDDVLVSAILFAPDGKRLYVALGGDIQVWDLTNGERISSTKAHSRIIKNIGISPDGLTLVTIQNEAILWSTETLQRLGTIAPPGSAVFISGCFVDGGTCIVLGDDQSGITVYDAKSLEQIQRVRSEQLSAILMLQLSPDGKFVAAAAADRSIGILEVDTWEFYALLGSHGDRVWDVKWSPTTSLLASCGGDGAVKFWAPPRDHRWASRSGIEAFDGEATRIRTLAYSPNGRILAAGLNERRIVLHDCQTENTVRLPVDRGVIRHVEFSRDGSQLHSSHEQSAIMTWDTATARLLKTVELPGDLTTMAVSPTGERCVVAVMGTAATKNLGQHFVAVLEWPNARLIEKIPIVGNPVIQLKFTPDGKEFVVVRVGEIAFYYVETQVKRLDIGRSGDAFADIAFLPGGTKMVVAEWRQGAAIRDVRSGDVLLRLSGHPGVVTAVAAHPNGQNVASICDRNVLQIWDLNTHQPLLRFTDVQPPIYGGLVFDPQGNELAMGQDREGYELSIWDGHPRGPTAPPQSGAELASPVSLRWPASFGDCKTLTTTLPNPIQAIGWTPDSSHVLLADSTGFLYRWKSAGGQSPEKLPDSTASPIRAILTSPASQRWFVVRENNQAQEWQGTVPMNATFAVPAGGLHLDPTGDTLIALGENAITAINTTNGEALWRKEHSGDAINCATTGKGFLVIGCVDGKLRFHRLENGETISESQLPGDWYWDLACSADGLLVAGARRYGLMDLLDPASGRTISTIFHPADTVFYLGQSQRLLCARETAVELFDFKTQKTVGTLPRLLGKNVVSPDGTQVAMCSGEKLVVFYLDEHLEPSAGR